MRKRPYSGDPASTASPSLPDSAVFSSSRCSCRCSVNWEGFEHCGRTKYATRIDLSTSSQVTDVPEVHADAPACHERHQCKPEPMIAKRLRYEPEREEHYQR